MKSSNTKKRLARRRNARMRQWRRLIRAGFCVAQIPVDHMDSLVEWVFSDHRIKDIDAGFFRGSIRHEARRRRAGRRLRLACDAYETGKITFEHLREVDRSMVRTPLNYLDEFAPWPIINGDGFVEEIERARESMQTMIANAFGIPDAALGKTIKES